ncbi:MAG: radical SAM family heme chaperone HemW [Acidobacteria bacterium]|nr:radical SAM family heme chaperone HemW [Acidobacteriota bacterium]
MNGGIYVHVPFCRSRCRYCSFYSVTGGTVPGPQEYAEALIRHFRSFQLPVPIAFNTVYFGGGTPSLMPASFFARVLDILSGMLQKNTISEITVELNPEDISTDYLKSLKSVGVNRISIGVQSTDDKILQKLGRSHTAEKAEEAVKQARSVFNNVSCDLIIGIEGEKTSADIILGSLPLAALSHLSLYMLDGEKNRKLAAGEDHTADLYMDVCVLLEEAGLSQYEISNFARAGMESVHNLHYWTGNSYIGLGPSAHSFLYPYRIWDRSGLNRFMKGEFREGREHYTRNAFVSEMVMLSLRLRRGAKQREFKERYHIDLFGRFGWLAEKFPHYVIQDQDGISLSREGMLVSNEIFQELISPR